ncbi:g2602 [Coccomyxa elongata]
MRELFSTLFPSTTGACTFSALAVTVALRYTKIKKCAGIRELVVLDKHSSDKSPTAGKNQLPPRQPADLQEDMVTGAA